MQCIERLGGGRERGIGARRHRQALGFVQRLNRVLFKRQACRCAAFRVVLGGCVGDGDGGVGAVRAREVRAGVGGDGGVEAEGTGSDR